MVLAKSFVSKLLGVFTNLENAWHLIFRNRFPPEAYSLAAVNADPVKSSLPTVEYDLKKIFDTTILWAVQRDRRSLERRMKRKYGNPDTPHKAGFLKLLVPKSNLLVCNTCGHYHEAGILCARCYRQIRAETKIMQKAIEKDIGLNPDDKEVIVLYEGEKLQEPKEFWQGKRIIEMKKERPPWFSKNLLQKSTTAPATSSDVKPTELG